MIGLISTRQAWRVLEVKDAHQANWAEQTRAAWESCGSPPWEVWPGRERVLLVEPPRNPSPTGKDRRGIRLSPWWRGEQWIPLRDPYPACVECGLLWPCPCDDQNREAVTAMAELDRLARILPGCCWGCGEPITGRQHSVVFAGENLLLPGGPPPAFHTSHSRKAARGAVGTQTCRSEAEAYEERWVAADVTRRVRLRCPGIHWRHYDGFSECSEGEECPGEQASHREHEHCTTRWFGGGREYYHPQWRELPSPQPGEFQPPTNCGGKGCRGVQPLPASSEGDCPTSREWNRDGLR